MQVNIGNSLLIGSSVKLTNLPRFNWSKHGSQLGFYTFGDGRIINHSRAAATTEECDRADCDGRSKNSGGTDVVFLADMVAECFGRDQRLTPCRYYMPISILGDLEY